ncbi:MAG: TraR/DksA family transcriptional regulator, partial [Candidatus Lindowbacteria bacterium]|nr:TraR/DksA family transcriptional regulator [Candidatus Lindowbacteria bacterium]
MPTKARKSIKKTAKKAAKKTASNSAKKVSKAAKKPKSTKTAKAIKTPKKKVSNPVKKPRKLSKNSPTLKIARAALEAEMLRLKTRMGLNHMDDSNRESVGDIADAASRQTNRAVMIGIRATEATQIEKIEKAMMKVEEGTYGNCVGCSGAIEPARLEAMPAARY